MSTYKVSEKWKTRKKKGFTDEHGFKWRKRRQVYKYEYGHPHPIDKYYEYKGRLEHLEERLPIDTRPTGEPSPDVGLITPATPTEYQTVDPLTGDVKEYYYTEQTSAQTELYNRYTAYLDSITLYNNELRSYIESYYELSAAKYKMTPEDVEDSIDSDYNLKKLNRLTYEQWRTKSMNGTLPPSEYLQPSLIDEYTYVSDLDKFLETTKLNKFFKGAQFGWEIAASTGLPHIAAMGIAGMPDTLVRSMAISTQIHGNVQRLMGQQDTLTYTLGSLRDEISDISGVSRVTTENYKEMYLRLNESAKRQGIIKGDWTLRLSRNIPIKERWRRLYVTLLAHIEQKQKLRG